jgi:hypothetical protein
MTVATRSVARARRQGAAGTTRAAAAPSQLAAALSLLAWALASSALIFMNKRIMVDVGFAYPLALTGAGQLVSAACAAAACRAGLWRPRLGPPPPSPPSSPASCPCARARRAPCTAATRPT